jgi:hypothetical protein
MIHAFEEAMEFRRLCQSSASAKPREGSLHEPAPWQDLKAIRFVRALDDLDRSAPNLL